MTNLDVLRAAAQQTWTPRPIARNDAVQKVSSSWSPPKAAGAEPPLPNGVHNLLHNPTSPRQYNRESSRPNINNGVPNFLQLLDIPVSPPNPTSDHYYRNDLLHFNTNAFTEYNNLVKQQQASSSFSDRDNSSFGFLRDNSQSPLSTSTPSPSTSPRSTYSITNKYNTTSSSNQCSSTRKSSVYSGENGSNNQNIGLVPSCFNPALGNLSGSWNLASHHNINNHPRSSLTSTLTPLNSLPLSHETVNSIHHQRNSGHLGLLDGRAGLTGSEIAAPRNCSDLIRSMAAKYNNRLNLYNSTLKSITRSYTSSNQQRKPETPTTFLPVISNTRSSSSVSTSIDKDNITLHKLPAINNFSTNIHTNNINSFYNPVSTKNNLTSSLNVTVAPKLFSSPHVQPMSSQGMGTTSEISSTQMLMNLVKNASNAQQKTFSQSTSRQNLQNDKLIQLQIQQRQYVIDNYLQRSAKRASSSGVAPLDLSSIEPAQKRLKLEHEHFIDVEGDVNKSEPSTPLDVETFSPFNVDKKELSVFGDLFGSPENGRREVSESKLVLNKNTNLSHETSESPSSSSTESFSVLSLAPTVCSSNEPVGSPVTSSSSCAVASPVTTAALESSSRVTSPSLTPLSVDNKKQCICRNNPTSWTVKEVHDFVKSIDICAEYADLFQNERIDGWSLSVLTESHLTGSLQLKLGPALKLRSLLDAKLKQAETCCDACCSDDDSSSINTSCSDFKNTSFNNLAVHSINTEGLDIETYSTNNHNKDLTDTYEPTEENNSSSLPASRTY